VHDPETQIILKLRSSAGYLTREELGMASGAGRAGAGRLVERLRDRGYRIDEVPGEGYRLVSSPDTLDACEVTAELRMASLANPVHAFASVDSTNDVASSLAGEGAPEGTTVVAEEQTGGKGRRGRRWHSPEGLGLWFSFILRPDLPARRSACLSLVAAASVASLLRTSCGVNGSVKWPNDVVVGPRKICGILTESEFAGDRVDFVVVGVGLNVLQRPADFPRDLRDAATSIRIESGRLFRRARLLADALVAFGARYKIFQSEGFGPIREELLGLSPLVGKFARIATGRGEIEGTAVDIDETGALILRTESGQLRSIIAGDVVRVM
jgi:BirA family biotin operon repressor/biotin-[acetyl-CoA-carboxylase] ligase